MAKSKSLKLEDKDEITWVLECSEDDKRVTLTVISPKMLTVEDYLVMLTDFIVSSRQQPGRFGPGKFADGEKVH